LLFAILAGGYHHIGTAGKFVCLALLQVKNPNIPPPSSPKKKTTNVPAVLLQLRRQPHHLHHPRRSLPDARPRLRARRQRRRRQVRRHPLGAAVQLSQRAGGYGAGECAVDFLRVLHSWRGGDVVSDPGDEGAGCRCDGL